MSEIYLHEVKSFLKTYPVDPALPKLTSDHGLPDGSLSSPMTCTRVPFASGPIIAPFGVLRAFAYVSLVSNTMHSSAVLGWFVSFFAWISGDV